MTRLSNPTWQLESEGYFSPRAAGGLVIAMLVALYAIAVLLISRRMMGALSADLPWPMLLVTALATFTLISGLRTVWRRTFPERTPIDAWIEWGASLTLVLFAGGLSFAHQDSRSWLVWVPLLIGDQLVRRGLAGERGFENELVAKPQSAIWGDQVQNIVRTRDAEGLETIHATLRADFQNGQRHATVYVGFCPPLPTMPEITVESAAGPAAELKIVQAFAHGARIDVRLAQTAIEPVNVVVNLIAK